MKKLPIGIQDFKKIREDNYLYIDKTQHILTLIEGESAYFISRPRRFGKSLLLSTLYYLFRGKKELFQNLYLYDKIQWEAYPVLRIDFSTITHNEGKHIFRKALIRSLAQQAKEYGITINNVESPSEYLAILIYELHQTYQKPLVLLIDEYDKPVVDNWGTPIETENRAILKGLFSILKGYGHLFRFILFTGITKLANLSLSAALNHVQDLSLDLEYQSILGITQDELETYCLPWLNLFAQEQNISQEKMLKVVKSWYNGYAWYDGKTTLYNPFGLLYLMRKRKIQSYWYSTSTPALLIHQIKKRGIPLQDFEGIEIQEVDFLIGTPDTVSIEHLLFQTGYLTIKEKKEKLLNSSYILGYPNMEVKQALLTHLAEAITETQFSKLSTYQKLAETLYQEDIPSFSKYLQSILAGIPYNLHIPKESYYHSIIYVVLNLLGLKVQAETLTDKGRIDSIIEFNDKIFIFEFKYGASGTDLDKLVDKALAQIAQKQYDQKYQLRNIPIKHIGIAFSEKTVVTKLITP